jgi:transcription antitermination protein NusB
MNAARRLAREAALQILYQWELGGASLERTLEAYWAVRDEEAPDVEGEVAVDREFAERLARGTADQLADLDPVIESATEHWRLSRLAVVDRLILRLATWELRRAREAPAAVVINEALELARRFSTEDAVRFINGVLDHVAKRGNEGTPHEHERHDAQGEN